MKQSQISLIVIGFILVALMATNPSSIEHKEAIKKEIFKAIESDGNSNSAQQLGEKIGEAFGGVIIDNMVERQNYVLFSLTTIKIVKQDGVTNNAITLGIFGQIILLKKYDKESKKFVDNTGFNGAESYVTTDTAAPVSSEPLDNESDNINLFNSNDIIGKTIKIGNLEVAEKDFPNKMNWENAKIVCERLGSGWRLPNKYELNILYQNKSKIAAYADPGYWSSTEGVYADAWSQYFTDNGSQLFNGKSAKIYVRAVRTF
jgi:hypothetical protein